ncbi:hypothetical protein MJO28_015364 [Puccinia striiformis f. sp. tritici]|uniref:Uncharacterized protein n=1 Tax=Puccinia striiformis f. sp. tritici TaxID=168172 RepID=A0ACC0DTV3_9BASI|nr:hypothetical protein MJO28_015364 [Puccinia striiformis f. sp. tritici]
MDSLISVQPPRNTQQLLPAENSLQSTVNAYIQPHTAVCLRIIIMDWIAEAEAGKSLGINALRHIIRLICEYRCRVHAYTAGICESV